MFNTEKSVSRLFVFFFKQNVERRAPTGFSQLPDGKSNDATVVNVRIIFNWEVL